MQAVFTDKESKDVPSFCSEPIPCQNLGSISTSTLLYIEHCYIIFVKTTDQIPGGSDTYEADEALTTQSLPRIAPSSTMSSDLLEFDTFYKSPQDAQPQASKSFSFFDTTTSSSQPGQVQANQPSAQSTQQNDDIWGDLSSFTSPMTPAQNATPQEDLWGSFGITATPPRPTTNVAKPNYQGGNIYKNDTAQPIPGIVRRSTFDLFNNDVHNMPEPPVASNNYSSQSNTRPTLPPSKGSSGGEILFDADEEADDDDDFGDFESVTPSASQPPPPPAPSQPLDDFFWFNDYQNTTIQKTS